MEDDQQVDIPFEDAVDVDLNERDARQQALATNQGALARAVARLEERNRQREDDVHAIAQSITALTELVHSLINRPQSSVGVQRGEVQGEVECNETRSPIVISPTSMDDANIPTLVPAATSVSVTATRANFKIPAESYPRFEGQRGEKLWEYITQCEKILATKRVTEAELLATLHLYSRGDGSNWFAHTGHIYTEWKSFKTALMHSFLSPNFQQTEEARLRDRRQGITEPFGAYCRSVWSQFTNIKPDMPEGEIVAVLLRNGHPNVTRRLAGARNYPRVEALIDAGNEAEARNEDEARYHALEPPPPINAALNMQVPPPSMGQQDQKWKQESNGSRPWHFKKKTKQCWRCGQPTHTGECQVQCGRCGQLGHRTDVCPASPKAPAPKAGAAAPPLN
jgi:hypothetical protein